DLVVLDWSLPKLSGIDVCRTLRAESPVPIIMLTAKETELERVLGLEMGADDYVVKPCSTRELVSRGPGPLGSRRSHDGDACVRSVGPRLRADETRWLAAGSRRRRARGLRHRVRRQRGLLQRNRASPRRPRQRDRPRGGADRRPGRDRRQRQRSLEG